MIRDELHPLTGLPLVKEERQKGGTFKALPKDYADLASEHLQPNVAWFPKYLEWRDNVLSRVRCWKCGTDLVGWKPVIDAYGNLVKRDGHLCLWLREHDHYTRKPFYVWWGVLKRQVQFDVLQCKDCVIAPADGATVVTCFLGGHDETVRRGWKLGLKAAMSKDDWATWLYRWSPAKRIHAEPIGWKPRKEAVVTIPTPGRPMLPSDYLQWAEGISFGQVPSGAVFEYAKATIPPGFKKGPRAGTIQKL